MSSLVSPLKKGLCFIISAPAGTGKTTLVNLLIKEAPSLVVNVSYTTRSPRAGEIDGQHYHFISEAEFKNKIEQADFLEYAQLYGSYYGSSRKWVTEQQAAGKHVILVIDTQGAIALKGVLEAIYIFISPPSLDVLRMRLSNRKTETPEMLEKRLVWARQEMQARAYYNYEIINDDLSTAYQVLRSIVVAESHRIRKEDDLTLTGE